MRNNENLVHIEGRLYQHSLAIKQVQNKQSKNFGKSFINGRIEIAVDEEGMNVIPVNFVYVSPTTAKGANNVTYQNLETIINSNRSWLEVGKDEALKIKIDRSAIAPNDFVNRDGELISTKQCEGGFVSIVNTLCEPEKRHSFIVDMIISGIRMVEANPERHIDSDYAVVKGLAFNYKNDIFPVEFNLRNPKGIQYIESLEPSASNPIYNKVWGTINCLTIEVPRTIESAFGGTVVIGASQRNVKEWLIDNMSGTPFEFGAEGVITTEELTKALQDRELHLATVKKEREQYLANKDNTTPASATGIPGSVTANFGEFKF